ncbi:MAG: glycosyltransferase family 4 protein [Litoreibacter sp.]|uniref:glycosyltransferase family 4 protein n=1 Tax=Litoreibacter sp. TaxID=1969459 RepID=UPI00329931F4
MNFPQVVHLVDDNTAGGVMRMLDYLVESSGLDSHLRQSVRKVNRHALSHGTIEADIIVSHLTLSWRGLPALVTLRAMKPTARIVHIEHSYTRAFTVLNVPHKKRFFAMLRVAYSLFDHVVAVSRDQADWLSERALTAVERLTVINPRVGLEAFSNVSPANSRIRVIGAIGRLVPQKGFDVLIDAFRACSHKDARLLIFGEGRERGHLEALAAGDKRIEFRGHQQDPTAPYREVDIVAIPSRWEAYGLVASEARAAGRPALVARVDGLRDQISGSVIAQDGNDVEAWTNTLERILTDGVGEFSNLERAIDVSDAAYVRAWMNVMGRNTGGIRRPTLETVSRQARATRLSRA